MSPRESQNRRSHDELIQKEQRKLDSFDSKIDGRIDLPEATPEQKEALKKTYFDRVNDLQGQIRRTLEHVDVKRDLRSADWHTWEDEAVGIERDLFILLCRLNAGEAGKESENPALTALGGFNAEIDELFASLKRTQEKYAQPKDSVEKTEKAIPRSLVAIFREWGVPGKEEEIKSKAARAVERYGEERIRRISEGVALYEKLPPALKEKVFRTSALILPEQVAGQLANGTFESSPLSILLTEDLAAIEKRAQTERESLWDSIGRLREEMGGFEERTQKQLVRLCAVTKEKVSDDTISGIVAWVANLQGYPDIQAKIVGHVRQLSNDIEAKQVEIDAAKIALRQLDLAFNAFDTMNARNAGRDREEVQFLFRQKYDFGQEIDLSGPRLSLLRPVQRDLVLGKFDTALETSIRDYNAFTRENPDVDIIDRTDVWRLRGARPIRDQRAVFENVRIREPHAMFNAENRKIHSMLLPRFDLLNRGDPERTVQVLKQAGKLPDGNELILVEIPPRGENASGLPITAIALRTPDGTIRLQNGTELEKPQELQPFEIETAGTHGAKVIYLSRDASSFISDNAFPLDGSSGVVLRNKPAPAPVASSMTTAPLYTLTTEGLQLMRRDAAGKLELRNADHALEKTIDTDRLEKERVEQGTDILRSIDSHPTVKAVGERATELQGNMRSMQLMLETAQHPDANISNEFVDQLHDFARPMLSIMEDPQTLRDAQAMQKVLEQQLSLIRSGAYISGGIEGEIQDRLNAITDYIGVLADNRLKNALQTAMEARPDTWAAWFSKDGLILLGAIVVAVAVVAVVSLFTAGLGTAPTLLLFSALGSAGGIIGAEGTKELLYQYHNTYGGAATGKYRYTEGSRLGNYVRGTKVFNPETGEFQEMTFLSDIAGPYALEFVVSFATSFAAMGAGHIAGSALSKLAQCSRLPQYLTKNKLIGDRVIRLLSGIGDDIGRAPANVKEFGTKVVKECLDELNDELILETATGEALKRIDKRLAFLAVFIVSTGKGFKPLSGGMIEYSSETSTDAAAAWAREQGHNVRKVHENGVIELTSFNGDALVMKPNARTVEQTPQTEAQIISSLSNDSTLGSCYLDSNDKGLVRFTYPLHVWKNGQKSPTFDQDVQQYVQKLASKGLTGEVKIDLSGNISIIQEIDGQKTELFFIASSIPTENIRMFADDPVGKAIAKDIALQASHDHGLYTFDPTGDHRQSLVNFLQDQGFRVHSDGKTLTADRDGNSMTFREAVPQTVIDEVQREAARIQKAADAIQRQLPPVPKDHIRLFRGIRGEYVPRLPLSSEQQTVLTTLKDWMRSASLEEQSQHPELVDQYLQLSALARPEMATGYLGHVLEQYANSPDSTLLYVDLPVTEALQHMDRIDSEYSTLPLGTRFNVVSEFGRTARIVHESDVNALESEEGTAVATATEAEHEIAPEELQGGVTLELANSLRRVTEEVTPMIQQGLEQVRFDPFMADFIAKTVQNDVIKNALMHGNVLEATGEGVTVGTAETLPVDAQTRQRRGLPDTAPRVTLRPDVAALAGVSELPCFLINDRVMAASTHEEVRNVPDPSKKLRIAMKVEDGALRIEIENEKSAVNAGFNADVAREVVRKALGANLDEAGGRGILLALHFSEQVGWSADGTRMMITFRPPETGTDAVTDADAENERNLGKILPPNEIIWMLDEKQQESASEQLQLMSRYFTREQIQFLLENGYKLPDRPDPSVLEKLSKELPAIQGAIAETRAALSKHPELAGVLEKFLLDVDHPVNVTSYLKDPARRVIVLHDLLLIAESKAIGTEEFSQIISETAHADHPLFKALDPELNETNGRKRSEILSEKLATGTEAELYAIGAGPTPTQRVLLDRYVTRLNNETRSRFETTLESIVREVDAPSETIHPDGFPVMSGRAKSAEGILDKIARMRRGNDGKDPRPGYTLANMPDAVGCRITVRDVQQLSGIMQLVEARFGKQNIYEKDSFYVNPKKRERPYRVITYTITVDGVPCELQLSTLSSSMTADLEHNTLYKPYIPVSSEEADLISSLQRRATVHETRHASERSEW